ncbi:MAG: hypothetical protein ACRD4K_04070 [Candidatus Acidiferrales bacterium]
MNGYKPSLYSIVQHQKSRYPLSGAHLAVICSECNNTAKSQHPAKTAPFRFQDLSCTGCHTDPHNGQFRDRMAQPGSNGKPLGCEACHNLRSWTNVKGFDHSKTSFPLNGAHARVSCDSCHKPSREAGSIKEVDFRSAPTACSSCHEDPHGGQFSSSGTPPNCANCHTSEHWKPSTFDHESGSTFSLNGAHQKVECALCHKSFRTLSGKRVLFYKPTPRECASCHS